MQTVAGLFDDAAAATEAMEALAAAGFERGEMNLMTRGDAAGTGEGAGDDVVVEGRPGRRGARQTAAGRPVLLAFSVLEGRAGQAAAILLARGARSDRESHAAWLAGGWRDLTAALGPADYQRY